MKTAEERLRFKNHFFKLGQGRLIPTSDTTYWDAFWKEPETTNDIYELLTPYDIRTIREQNRANFVLMIRVLILRFTYLAQHENFPSRDAPVSELLNCIRFLTKLLPFLFELPEYYSELDDILFWSETFDPMAVATGSSMNNVQTPGSVLGGEKENGKEKTVNKENILGVNIVKCLVDLLFIRSFTMDVPTGSEGRNGSNRMMCVWEPGIGTTAKYQTPNLIIDSNRMEVLKLMLVLMSTSVYLVPSQVVSNGSKFLTLLVATMPRVELLILVCSLMNLLCRSARSPVEENMLFYSNIELTEMRHLCVTYATQLLTLMIVYPLPSQPNLQFLYDLNLLTTAKPYNMARVYIGKLRKENELLFLASYLINVLRAPMQNSKESESLKFNLNGRQNQVSLWATECTMLLWELFQCNKSFRILVGERYLHELLVIMLYYVCTYHRNVNHKNSVRIFSYFILYLSSDCFIMDKLFEPMDITFYESLPTSYKTIPGPVTYRDFIVTQICKLLIALSSGTNSANNSSKPSLLLTTLVEILYNLIPVVSSKEIEVKDDPAKKLGNSNPRGGLSYAACSSITQLIIKFSTRPFLLEASFNADLLALIFRSVCTAIIKYPKPSRMLLFSMLKNEKVYDQVWNTIYSFSTEYFSGETLVLNSIDDNEDENISPLQQIDSNRSDLISINSSIESEKNEPIFINNFTSPKSRHGSNVYGSIQPLTPEFDLNFFEDESQAIDSALRPKPPTGMSQKARDKLPKDSPLKRSWGGNDSLRIILTIIIPHLKLVLKEIWSSREGPSIDSFLLVKYIESTDFDKLINENKGQLNYDFLPTTPLEPLKFNWSHLSLGWYMSLLFGNVYNAGDNVKTFTGYKNKIMKNFSSTLVSFSKLTSGWAGLSKQLPGTGTMSNESDVVSNWVESALTNINPWAYTSIKLFKIEPAANEGFFGSANAKITNNVMASPSTPTGVNDMASTLARKFSDFRIRNNSSSSISSMQSASSILNTPIDEQEACFGKYVPRNSVSSLHSLNTLNRSRTNTPRNSVCM